MILIFEGVDKVGKTTLIKEFHTATNFVHPVIDRFTGTTWVYDKIYERNVVDEDQIFSIENSFNKRFHPLLVLVFCSNQEEHQERLARSEDKGMDFGKVVEAQRLFYQYFHQKTKYEYKIMIDTYNRSTDECVKEIVARMKAYEKENGAFL